MTSDVKNGTVQREERIEGLDDMARINARMMEEAYNDSKLSLESRMKMYSTGVRNAIGIRAEQRKTALDVARMGMKLNGQLNRLTFDGDAPPKV